MIEYYQKDSLQLAEGEGFVLLTGPPWIILCMHEKYHSRPVCLDEIRETILFGHRLQQLTLFLPGDCLYCFKKQLM